MKRPEEFYERFFSINSVVKKQLTGKRYLHSRGVAELAVDLCNRFGADAEKGFLAGILHDIAREMNPVQWFHYASLAGLFVTEKEQQHPVLMHAKIGAFIAQNELGIVDTEILQAICAHISGGTGLLDQIIFIADYLEPSRTFIDESERIQVLTADFDSILLYVLENTIRYLENNGLILLNETITLLKEVKVRTGS